MPTAARRTPPRETVARVEPEEFRDIIQADHPEDAHQYLVAILQLPRKLHGDKRERPPKVRSLRQYSLNKAGVLRVPLSASSST